ncbi:neuroligin 4-like [Palaemon carinicauda]|uniref:neuroligin 4-like n=1 Tax=Palaemon carinicauda TaxID=392227 RepID=UPI0035B6714B
MKLGNVAPDKQINVFSLTVLINFSILCDLTSCEGPPKTPAISTKYGQLRGFYQQVTDEKLQVATYLGIPYATPPIAANRFSPTRALSQWVGVHEATHFGPSCPQRFPDLSNETEALTRMTKDRYDRLRKYQPALKRQSEDCLYLNIYVPPKESIVSLPKPIQECPRVGEARVYMEWPIRELAVARTGTHQCVLVRGKNARKCLAGFRKIGIHFGASKD